MLEEMVFQSTRRFENDHASKQDNQLAQRSN